MYNTFSPCALDPATAPTNVTATFQSQGTITVVWEEVMPIHQNGIVILYEVNYQPLQITINNTIPGGIVVNVTEQSTNLTNLQEFVNYIVSVRAYNRAGMGPYSNGITVTPGKST